MTNMREAWRQCPAATIAAPCSSNDQLKLLSWRENELLSRAGSPP